ncbi:germination protein [Anaerocolumna cellulosilytica]|uniref:Germination protein n=1 Tax=Anaerocolumna cellulosilytica TaxID=433286 RepID=A0A6S6QTK4_9FIRM|nr:LysM peptidoglycan-binding domain-containing protein [Anaerocolumna cellulosilytica]MBB5196692.1 spore germination protein [Anaerocolumna cellulosilytica]BCJ93954.1 germination protein [Anaerocolumna cellulosilytica]
MIIHVVKPGETLTFIADYYGVSQSKLIQDNDIINPNELVVGQTIVIAYPEQTYTVEEGDTLEGIASRFNVTILQLLRNNPSISDRTFLEIGETLVISYKTGREITTNGFAYAFIEKSTLIKTLPYLTFLSLFNYTVNKDAELIPYFDESEIIQLAKAYDVVPLMSLTTLTTAGVPDLTAANQILLSDSLQEHLADNTLKVIQSFGYSGVNITFSFLSELNQELYHSLLSKLYNRLKKEGYLVFSTINPNIRTLGDRVDFSQVDYGALSKYADTLGFSNFVWGTNYGPPTPVSSNYNQQVFLNYITPMVPGHKIEIGTPVIGYDWELSYISSIVSNATSLTINAAIQLASNFNIPIDFDETSQTPFFLYNQLNYYGLPARHIVWFIDARTINSILDLIMEYGLQGKAIWNVMIFYAQMWLIINSQYKIVKFVELIK